jgi:predicted nucleic acid-binding protein
VLLPDAAYWDDLRSIVLSARVSGNLTFDAQIAAVFMHHGVVLLTEDRDFARFGILTTRL